MSLEVVRTVLAVLGGAVLIGIVVLFLLGVGRRGPLEAVRARRDSATRDEVAALAHSRAWSVTQESELAQREPDPRLAAERALPTTCVQVIDGGGDGFTAETWTAGVRNLGSPVRLPAHQHLVRFSCPATPWFLVRGMPSRHELRHFPVAFREQSGFVRFHTSMLVGGQFGLVQDRLGPLIEAIDASRLWVIGVGDQLILLSGSVPGPDELERRIALGRVIVDALGSPPGATELQA